MGDLLRECNSGDLKTDPKTFRDTWCARCSRQECDLARYAKNDPMAHRNATWRERFFGAPEADLTIPKFARIAKLDFPNLLQKAMKLEVSERRGDWSVPEIPVLDGRVVSAPDTTTRHVDEAVRRLGSASGCNPLVEDEPEVEDPVEDDEPEDDPLVENPAPRLPIKVEPRPTGRNTPDPGEVLLGGPAPVQRGRPVTETDPWTPPPKPVVTVVKAGAKIQFGTGGKGKVVDG